MTQSTKQQTPHLGMYRLVSIALLIVVIMVTSLLFYRVMIGFFIPLFLAALLVVLFHPLHNWFKTRLTNRPRTAAALTTASVLLIVLIPCGILLGVASVQATQIVRELNLGSIDVAFAKTLKAVGLELPYAAELESIDGNLTELNQIVNLSSDSKRAEQQLTRLERQFNNLRDAILARGEGDHNEFFVKVESDLADLRSLLAQATSNAATVEAAGQPSEAPSDQLTLTNQFHRAVRATTREYREFKNEICGGPLLGPIRQTVNPTAEKREAWIREGFEFIQPRVVKFTQATAVFAGKAIIGIAILTISIYFFLLDGPAMTQTIMGLSPLDDRYEAELLVEFDKISRAVVLATFLSALAQGVLATIGYYFAGVESIVLLFLLTTFMALIPFLGAAAVWLPCCVWLAFVQDQWFAALALGIYGAVVVSMADNIIKPLVLKGQSNLHPLLALLSVLGGVHVFGPIGILMGPMIVVFLQTLLDILNRELSHIDEHHGRLASSD